MSETFYFLVAMLVTMPDGQQVPMKGRLTFASELACQDTREDIRANGSSDKVVTLTVMSDCMPLPQPPQVPHD